MRIVRDEGSGPVVVLLHGQPGLGTDLDRVVVGLRGQAIRVLTLDRPGYGSSSAPATGFRGNAVALAHLLDQVAPGEQLTLLGLSWGGAVALSFAALYPHRVRGLILAASVGVPESLVGTDRLLTSRWVAKAATRLLPYASHLVGTFGGSRLTAADRAFLRRTALRWGRREWGSFRVEQRALLRELPELQKSLHPKDFPVTVVQGRRDRYIPRRAGQLLATRLNARYLEVEAGHLLNLEVPLLLAAEVRRIAVGSST